MYVTNNTAKLHCIDILWACPSYAMLCLAERTAAP